MHDKTKRMSLESLVSALLRRGCPTHPRVVQGDDGYWRRTYPDKVAGDCVVHPDDVRAMWESWALWWLEGLGELSDRNHIHKMLTLHAMRHHHRFLRTLDAVEFATRRMEPRADEEDDNGSV